MTMVVASTPMQRHGPCIFPAICAGAMPCRSSKGWRPTAQSPWTRSIASPDGSRRAPGKPISIASGARSGLRWRIGSLPSPTPPPPNSATSPPATTTCARATITTAPNASSRPGRRRWRCITRHCARITRPWNACIPRSSASRFPTRTRACPPISCRAKAPAAARPSCCSTGWTTPRK